MCLWRVYRLYLFSVLSSCLMRDVFSTVLASSMSTNVAHTAYEMCPYTSFCRSYNISVPEGYYSCCEECSCSDDCHLVNQCCPDADIRNTNTDLICKYQFEYFDVHRNIFSEVQYQTYFIVDTCEEGQNEEIVNGCLRPSSLEDHILVSDKMTYKIYKNAKCAQCNGVQKYDTWDLLVFCSFDEALLSFERRADYALEHCSFVSRPTKGTANVYKSFRCSPDVISTCNVSSEWDFYDEDLVRACSTYNMPYKEEKITPRNIVKNYRIYKNIYCYLCNNKRGTTPKEVCLQDIDLERDIPTTFAPFTAILGFDESETLTTDVTAKCHIDEIEDPFTGECTHLDCPLGEAPIHGSCVVIIHEPIVSLSAVYELDITTTSFVDLKNQDFILRVFKALVDDVQTKFAQVECEICDILVFTEHTALIRAKPSTSCPMSRLLKVYKYMAQMKVSSQADKMDIQIKQTNNNTVVQRGRYLSIEGLETTHQFTYSPCRAGVQLTTKFYCERITYSKTDLAASGVKHETIEKLMAVSDPYGLDQNVTDKYLICLSDYKRIKNASPKHVSCLSLNLVLLFLVVSVSV